ncbi:SslE/AcfD family lipoprotein zinc metalloprotease [Aliivibrio sifiae]|uniref:Sugar ABC transporter substrate-binding protein n=1 Tax=Aliivibrio sifiae TaxID=566293 RepID=A0A2S7XB42_9GAMM|nr:SslE/AcfD family lipoprotein zinc metalloprotease [Aliivibrio sifiae]PQJ88578.1 sugar ABC transporter substrate-binding protein [Aliivibrio sifiae]
MSKKLLLASLVSMLLTGCNQESIELGGGTSTKPETIPPTDIIPPEPTPDPEPVTYFGKLTAGGQVLKGELICDGEELTDGTFEIGQGRSFDCQLGTVQLGSFTAPIPNVSRVASPSDKVEHSFNLVEQHGENVTKVLQSINSCDVDNTICLTEFDSIDIQDIYLILDDNAAVTEFVELKDQQTESEATDEVDKAPSSHVDANVKPEESEGVSPDLNSDFVSASAEETYVYKPSVENQILTVGKLTDINGKALNGVSFFSDNSRGVTGVCEDGSCEDGSFKYVWGDKLTFGIDTFEFGAIKGNKLSYKITDVTDNAVTKNNIQSLLERYGDVSGDSLVISENVTDVFSEYPNVINELINFRLPNGGLIEGTTDKYVPNEFNSQFESGLTSIIDAKLKNNASDYKVKSPTVYSTLSNGTYVTDSLNSIFNNVETFHVFHDNQGGYGATGWVRGNRVLNLSNRAFPVMMDRNDINRLIPFDSAQAWTREGKPYIAEYKDVSMPNVPTVKDDTATYGLPFVGAGEIGKGKVVFMGNSMYPSILSCPDNFWANGWNEVRVNAQSKECTSNVTESDPRSDKGDMQRYFINLFDWFKAGGRHKVATNIDQGVFAQANNDAGLRYDFFIDETYGLNVSEISTGGFNLDPIETPILILQAYGTHGSFNNNAADLNDPKLTQKDITDLIHYINEGGNVLFMDGIDTTNPEPIARLADAAGVSLGGPNVANVTQSNCDAGNKYCNKSPVLNQKQEKDIVVLQRFDNLAGGKPPFTVNEGTGFVTWASAADMLSTPFHVPTYRVTNSDGSESTHRALIRVNNAEEREAAFKELEVAFPGTPRCTHEYEYEFNCIEKRSGTGVTERAYGRADFERIQFEVSSMVKAASLGSNMQALGDHELYYRSGGKQGKRLPINELNQTYDNMSTWLWNNNDYHYDAAVGQDELGFKRLVEYMNCYTSDTYGGNAECPTDLKTTLVANNMIVGEGELAGFMNPSYPLNYQEKPLTRIMLGRSFWDYRIKVDTTSYPTRPDNNAVTTTTIDIETDGVGVSFSAGNNQSTGMWLPQHEVGTVTGSVSAIITVMFADDLTGRPQHETGLKRPPRMTKTFKHEAGATTNIDSPYGGLVYIQPLDKNGIVQYTLSGVMATPLYKNGAWVTAPANSGVKLAEIDTGSFIYTTHVNNVADTDLDTFSAEMNRFADAASDFYGRDEVVDGGNHRRFTYPELKEFRHRFVNDVQISIGAAHSGYPVMNSSFNANSTTIPTKAKDDWLLWHEAGHNLAAAPFMAPGSTEVTNNLLALYMQELEGRNDNPRMDRIIFDIKKAPSWLNSHMDGDKGHAWANGNAGMRLVMLGQLKVWAESHFAIDAWNTRANVEKSPVYGTDEGWNMIKLMHRLARDNKDAIGTNYCSTSDTKLSGGDLMMMCSSYVSGYDLSDFFIQWNVGESSTTTPDGKVLYTGGISQASLDKLAEMKLTKPESGPQAINALPN